MAEQIRPKDLVPGSPNSNAALIFDDGVTVRKGTPLGLMDAARPLASQAEAEVGADNAKIVSPLRVKQAIEAIGVSASKLAAAEEGKGASLVGFLQAGLNAVSRIVLDKLRERVTIEDFGGVGDGVTDDTNALNRFLAAVSAGACGTISYKTFRFTSPLTPVSGEFIKIKGEGGRLLYAGAATTGDLLTFGDGANKYRRLDIRGFRVDSATTMTGGNAIRLRKYVGVDVDVTFGNEYGTWRIYDGVWLEECTDIRLHSSNFCALHDGVKWNSGYELHMMNATVKGLVVNGYGTGTGIRCGGACGGFYSESVTQLLNDVGMRIDTTLTPSGNFQFFFFGGTFDTNRTASLFVDDAVSDPLSKVIIMNGWMASSSNPGNGGGIVVANWRDGTINIDGQLINHTGTAVYTADMSAKLVLGRAALIKDNGGFGIHALASWNVDCSAVMRNNALGSFSINVMNRNVLSGSQIVNVDVEKQWPIDLTGAGAKSVASGVSITLPAGSGLLLIQNDTSSDGAVFFTYGGNVVKLGGGLTMVAGAPAANQIGVRFASGFYTITNGYAATQNIYVGSVRMRPTS